VVEAAAVGQVVGAARGGARRARSAGGARDASGDARTAGGSATADAYPSTAAGLSARYQAASVLVSLGRDNDAAQRFQEVADKAGTGLHGRVARLGLADVQVRQGKFDLAIATYKELAATAKDDLPVDGVLMALGRAYVAAGKKTEAGQTFKRIGDEFPTSPYAVDAKKALETLKGSGA
jgi:TolA-binding protein